MTLPQYTVFTLPKTLNGLLLRRFASLNFEAIRAIEDRFLLYAPDLLKSTASFEKAISQPDYTCLILAVPNIDTGSTSLEESQWVGMIILRGPLDAQAYNWFHLEKIQPDPAGPVTRWTTARFYLKEQHRNVEAMRLMDEAFTNTLEQKTRARYSAERGVSVTTRLQVSAYHGNPTHEYHTTNNALTVAEFGRKQVLEYDGCLETVPEGFLEGEDLITPICTVFEYVRNVVIK
ncbi:hypothetical protein NM208_g4416 [Fusarium decemcellulare]|uniref:Uncharacterized protein n=1 Tax=Fusarium decemcellulare TaxID=57161 RepID=A0ACC1SKV7_9HYPO|nr:hypothetical protein NM208_g4416 [Fusarium decemcellulare]